MNKKGISILVSLSMAAAFLAVLSCHCAGGDCRVASKAVQAATPQCHHGASSSDGTSSSSKDCCGQCQIEKAAFFDHRSFLTGKIQSEEAPGNAPAITVEIHKKTDRPVSSAGPSFGSPGSFFIRRILNASIAFRAPPEGGLCFAV